jgi:hypothetical protein
MKADLQHAINLRAVRTKEGHIVEVGGPDLSQMEPTDQLDAPDRRLPTSCLGRLLDGIRLSRTRRFPAKSDRFNDFPDSRDLV